MNILYKLVMAGADGQVGKACFNPMSKSGRDLVSMSVPTSDNLACVSNVRDVRCMECRASTRTRDSERL
jgi:hypothetical protein